MICICPHCGADLVRDDQVIVSGPFSYDPRAGVSVAGERLQLRSRCHEIMGTLMRAEGRILSAPTICDRIGSDASDPANIVLVYRTEIKKAVRALGLADPIRTVWGRGFHWALPVGVAA